jgi:hypothetical protein
MKAMNQNLLDKKLPAAVKRAWSKAVFINQAVTRQTRLQLVSAPPDPNRPPPDSNRAPPDPNRVPPGPDPAQKPCRTGLGRLALSRRWPAAAAAAAGAATATALVSECRCRRCRRWHCDGDGDGDIMVLACWRHWCCRSCDSVDVVKLSAGRLGCSWCRPHPIRIGGAKQDFSIFLGFRVV